MVAAIFATNQRNDADLVRALGSAVEVLPIFTDCLFAGEGEGGASILVAVERKKILDLAKSICDGRLIMQMQVCKEMGCEVMIVIVEGACRANPNDGLLEVPGWGIDQRTGKPRRVWKPTQPSMVYSRFDQYLTDLVYLAGVIVKRSWSVYETADIIKALYNNFQNPTSAQNSLHQIFSAPNPESTYLMGRPSLLRRVAKELPFVSWQRGKMVENHFKTVYAMATADEGEWERISGIGTKTAHAIVAEIRGET